MYRAFRAGHCGAILITAHGKGRNWSTMKRIKIARIKNHDDIFRPSDVLCWVRTRDGIWMSCANGHWSGLGNASHTIAANGNVTPSIVCAHDGCDFHEYGTLDDYHE